MWIVVTDPDNGTPPRVVIVMVLTARSYTDSTVLLQAGEHPFIDRESSVHFSAAQLISGDQLIRLSTERDCGIESTLAPAVLARVQTGILNSVYTVGSLRDYCAMRLSPPPDSHA